MSELIICGTDFSPESESALAWAANLAKRDGDTLELVHVVPTVRTAGRALVLDIVALSNEQLMAVTTDLEEAARVATEKYGVAVRPQLLRGAPHEQLLRHARQETARMVVLGTGLAALDRWMLGSVAERVLRSLDRPLVLVPRLADPAVWAAAEIRGESRAPRVVVGLAEPDPGALLRFVNGLRRSAPCHATFLHLYWPLEEYARLGLPGRRDLFKPDPDVAKNLEPGLRAKMEGLSGEGAVRLDIRPAWGEPSSNLLAAVEDAEADLLVVGAHQRQGVARFLTGSIAQRLARHSRYVPIAVVPEDPVAAPRPVAIPRIHTVLAVTDLSPLGNAAIPHAYGLVRAAGGVIELCHVHEHALPSPAYAYDAPAPSLSDLERARLTKELQALIPQEAKAWGVATHLSLVDGGKAAEAIVQASERLDVDAIVMGSHGRTGLAGTLLGAVAQEVVHRAHRPVYLIRSK